MQSDLDKLVDWSVKWKLGFNEDKFKVMNIGNSAIGKTVLSMKSSSREIKELNETLVERDLGIMLNHKLNWKDQVDNAVQRAQFALVMLKRTFKHWNADNILALLRYCQAV